MPFCLRKPHAWQGEHQPVDDHECDGYGRTGDYRRRHEREMGSPNARVQGAKTFGSGLDQH